MFYFVEDVVQLCRDWPHLEKSFEKYAIAAVVVPVLLVGFVNLPWILFSVFTWLLVSRFCLTVLMVARTVTRSVPFLSQARPSQRLLTGRGRSVAGLSGEVVLRKHKVIPGRAGLPFIGETVSFLADSRRFLLDRQKMYGNTFQTSIDFSGTFLAARRVVCLFQAGTSQAPRTISDPVESATSARSRSQLKYIGYSGLYGSSQPVKQYAPTVAERVLNEVKNLDRWEDVATPIIQVFLRRLIFESSFSFADRVNELACELVSAVFLNIPGYSPALQQSLDRYLATSLHNPSFNASLKDRKQISNCIHVAAYEEDRRYFSRDWRDFDADFVQQPQQQYAGDVLSPGADCNAQCDAVLSELLETCTEVLKQGKIAARNAGNTGAARGSAGAQQLPGAGAASPGKRSQLSTTLNSAESGSNGTPAQEVSTEVTAREAHDLLFVFLVEVVYSTLVQQLRALVQYIVTNQDNACAQARDNYKAYLTARQLVGNVSGTGLARFSWASTLYPDEEEVPQGYDQEGYPDRSGEKADTEGAAGNASASTVPYDEQRPEGNVQSSIGSYLLSHIWQPSPLPTPARPVNSQTSAVEPVTPPRSTRSPSPSPISRTGSSTRQLQPTHAFPVSPDEPSGDDLNYSCSTISTAATSSSAGAPVSAVVTTTAAAVYTSATDSTAPAARRYTDQRPPYIATTPSRDSARVTISSASPLSYTPSGRTQPGSSSVHSGSGSGVTSSTGWRYSGRYGPRRTPQKTPLKGFGGATPSRSVLRGASSADTRDMPSPMHDRSLLGIGSGLGLGSGMGGGGSEGIALLGGASVSKRDWRYREMLIMQYITSIKDLVGNAKASTELTPLPLQYSLHLCTQTHDIVSGEHSAGTPAEKVQYTIHKDDLVIQVHAAGTGAGTGSGITQSAASTSAGPSAGAGASAGQRSGNGGGSTVSPYSQSPLALAAHQDLGLFSELVMSIFTHELITGYLWEAPNTGAVMVPSAAEAHSLEGFGGAHVREPLGFCAVPNGGVPVRKYRTSNENISFLISAQGSGGGPLRGLGMGENEDDVRYYSDGL